jgi:glycerol-3-phosphate O-acyltransferase
VTGFGSPSGAASPKKPNQGLELRYWGMVALMTALAIPKKPPTFLAGRGMPRRRNLLVRLFSGRVLRGIPYPEDDLETLRGLAQKGTLVYVHRARNVVEMLALTRAVKEHGLPHAGFVGGMRVKWQRPFFGLYPSPRLPRDCPKDPDAREEWLLSRCVEEGHAAELFLRRPLTLVTSQSEYRARYVEALVALQRRMDRPIYLVPHFLALRSRPQHFEPTAADALFGTSGEPGPMRALARALLQRKTARWEVSDAVNLQAFVAEHGHLEDAKIAKKVRWALLHHLARIERSHHGPAIKHPARMKQDTLKDPKLKNAIVELSQSEGLSEKRLNRRAERMYDEIAARFDIDVARLLDRFLRFVWNRIYDGLEFEEKDIDRLRHASRRGPLILIPSHKSHVDYLVMSQVLFWNGLMPPHCAAGVNLSFFPLGPLFRRGGAYFLRRTFKGEKLYPVVFKAYISRLFREGFTQEFFIEGGRSRTGKTLAPKMGMLRMLLDAFLDSKEDDTIVAPASIAYEKIVEGKSYTRELGGAKKEKETAAALLKSAEVLRHKYGRVFVTFDETVSVKDFMADMGLDRDNLSQEDRRRLVQVLAHRIVYGINRATVVTATAVAVTALFGHRKRGLERNRLMAYCRQLKAHIEVVAGEHARFSRWLEEDLEGSVDRAVGLLARDGLLHTQEAEGKTYYRIDEADALELDYYKNNIIHHFVSEAIVASAHCALGGEGGKPVPLDELAAISQTLSRIFKFEFIYPVGKGFAQLFEETMNRMDELGFLKRDGDSVVLPEGEIPGERRDFAANLLVNFVDAYRVAATRILQMKESAENKKALVSSLLESLKAAWLSGELTCPEARSKAVIENAVAALVDQGFVLEDESGALGLNPEKAQGLSELTALLERARPHSA